MRLLKFLTDTFSRTRAQRREALVEELAERQARRKRRAERLSQQKLQPIRVVRVRRNAKCPCGSGVKFKHCCKELLPIDYAPPKRTDKRLSIAN